MTRSILTGLALVSALFATAAGAEGAVQPPTTVAVGLGPAVQARLGELGHGELQQQAAYLQASIQRAVDARHASLAAVKLAIVDIEPNRPTSAQLDTSPQLSLSGSFGLGGAAVSGEVITRDGQRIPVRYRFFQDNVRDEENFTTWGDADQAFDTLAQEIGAGRPPQDDRPWPAAHAARVLTGTRIPG